MNHMPMLIRREFWEHRSLWIAPLVWVGIIVVLWTWLMFVMLNNEHIGSYTNAQSVEQLQELSESQRQDIKDAMAVPGEHKQAVFAFSYFGISALISVFVIIVVFFYLIDCLFTERRDRSILFWKSLPLSDTEVVLSKLAVALVVVPLGALVLSAVTQLVLYGIASLRFSGTLIGTGFLEDWSLWSWVKAQAVILAGTAGGVLWYAPIAAYFLLLSVWARKLVFLWAIVPMLAIPLLELFFFHTSHVFEFLGQRFGGFVREINLNTNAFNMGSGHMNVPSVDSVFDALDMTGMFTSLEMWIGVAAAAAMVYVTIRIRRYRDDS